MMSLAVVVRRRSAAAPSDGLPRMVPAQPATVSLIDSLPSVALYGQRRPRRPCARGGEGDGAARRGRYSRAMLADLLRRLAGPPARDPLAPEDARLAMAALMVRISR